MANRLLAYTGGGSRVGPLCEARWEQFDLEGPSPTWTIPRTAMKAKEKGGDHVIPLSRTIVAELRTWREMTGGDGFVFASPWMKQPYINKNTLSKLYSDALGTRLKWRA
jgi:integrase